MQLKSIQTSITIKAGLCLLVTSSALAALFIGMAGNSPAATFSASRALALSFAIVALGTIALWVVAGWAAKPVRKISRYARGVAAGSIKSTMVFAGTDDCAAIVQSINRFVERGTADHWRGGLAGAPQRNPAKFIETSVTTGESSGRIQNNGHSSSSDAFRTVTTEIRKLVGLAQTVSRNVVNTAGSTRVMTEELVHETEKRAASLLIANTSLEKLASSIQEMSEHATLTSTVVQRSISNSQQGSQAMQNSIKTMQRVHQRSGSTAEKLKQLKEGSTEVSNILQTMSSLTKRTSYLALNTAIQAAEAGQSGQGFTVLAEEIERMARRSSEATRQIDAIFATIQAGTEDAISALDDNCQDAQDGSNLAELAAHVLNEVLTTSQELADLTSTISQAAAEQNQCSLTITGSVSEFLALNQKATEQIRQSAASVMGLEAIASELRETVASIGLAPEDAAACASE